MSWHEFFLRNKKNIYRHFSHHVQYKMSAVAIYTSMYIQTYVVLMYIQTSYRFFFYSFRHILIFAYGTIEITNEPRVIINKNKRKLNNTISWECYRDHHACKSYNISPINYSIAVLLFLLFPLLWNSFNYKKECIWCTYIVCICITHRADVTEVTSK